MIGLGIDQVHRLNKKGTYKRQYHRAVSATNTVHKEECSYRKQEQYPVNAGTFRRGRSHNSKVSAKIG